MRRLVQGIGLGLALTWGVGVLWPPRSGGSPAQSSTPAPAAQPAGEEPGQWLYWQLPDTPAEEWVDQPRLRLDISLWDAHSGQVVEGEVHISALAHATGQPLLAAQRVCQGVASCHIALPADQAEVRWRLTVRAAGYQTWSSDLRVVSHRDRSLALPVQLQPLPIPPRARGIG